MGKDRIANILANEPAVFEIVDWEKAKPKVPIYEMSPNGLWAIWVHQDVIEYEAKRQGVDLDLIKAIVYFENARGAAYGHVSEYFGVSDTILPMNISHETWGGLVRPSEDFSDPLVNVRAGVTLIRRIQERIKEPSVAKVAPIYHIAGRENVHRNGARVAEFYAARPWERALRSLNDPHLKVPPQTREFWAKKQHQRKEMQKRLVVE